MQRHEHRLLSRVGVMLVLSLGGCFEVDGLEPTTDANDEDFDLFDENDDGEIDIDEFRVGFADANVFDRFDVNRDALVSEVEFQTGLFQDFDTDGDNQLTRVEYDRGVATFARTAATPGFAELDADLDNFLTSAEFSPADDAVFDAFDLDGDGLLRDNEFDEGFFDAFDRDFDDALSPTEFDAATF